MVLVKLETFVLHSLKESFRKRTKYLRKTIFSKICLKNPKSHSKLQMCANPKFIDSEFKLNGNQDR